MDAFLKGVASIVDGMADIISFGGHSRRRLQDRIDTLDDGPRRDREALRRDREAVYARSWLQPGPPTTSHPWPWPNPHKEHKEK